MYAFALEPLLTQRRFIEESLQKELAAIQDQFNFREKALRQLIASRESCGAKLRHIGKRGARISELRLYSEYFKRLSIEEYEMVQALERLAENLDAKRDEVVAAMKGRKILENLKEKGLRTYHHRVMKKAIKSADETAILQFNRKGL
ncbi:MAG: flagellar export protein FliJ [Desulfobacterales bacterium]|nr:flagellar export protein FliJ [Desulfobacterales bacterium]